MTENSWWSYVETTLNGASHLEAGRRAGFDASAFTRWKKGARPDVDFVVKFARAYGRPVVEAIAAAGFITSDEADLREVKVGAHQLSDPELIEEIGRRLSSTTNVGASTDTEVRDAIPITTRRRQAGTRAARPKKSTDDQE